MLSTKATMFVLTTRSIDPFFHTYYMDNMNAINEIKETYTLEDFKEIANHGCQSGMCHEHIYYGDTLKFYEDNEDEILEYIRDAYSTNFLVEMFSDADANLGIYKNNIVWCFIEMIAFEVDEEIEIRVYEDDYAMANAY